MCNCKGGKKVPRLKTITSTVVKQPTPTVTEPEPEEE